MEIEFTVVAFFLRIKVTFINKKIHAFSLSFTLTKIIAGINSFMNDAFLVNCRVISYLVTLPKVDQIFTCAPKRHIFGME